MVVTISAGVGVTRCCNFTDGLVGSHTPQCAVIPLCRFLEFLVVRYPVQVALGLFITVGGLLLAFFLAYQVSCEWDA
jgi:hypothetical protein